jgi:hypothetical protein
MTHVPTTARPRHPVAEGDGIGGDGRQKIAWRDFHAPDIDAIGAVQAQCVNRLELVDEVRTERVLERDALHAAEPARDQEHLLVLDVHAFDRTDPLRKRKQLRGAERLGRDPRAVLPVGALPHDRRVKALLDGGPDGEDRGEGETRDPQVAAVADVHLVDLVDLVEEMGRGVAGEHVGKPRVHAHPHQGEPTGGLPLGGAVELLVRELDACEPVRLSRMRP